MAETAVSHKVAETAVFHKVAYPLAVAVTQGEGVAVPYRLRAAAAVVVY